MPTRQVGRSSVSHSNARTPARSRAARGTVKKSGVVKSTELVGTGVVRVWSEASVTVNVGEPGFIKFTHGFEKTTKNDKRSIVQAEREIFEACEEIVDRRLKRLAKLMREMEA